MGNNRLHPTLLALAFIASAAAHADETPEQRMAQRFPQPVKVGDLIGLPVYDDNQSTLGHVREVVRTPAGKIELVGIFGRQLAALDMSRQEFANAPTWSGGDATPISPEDTIRIGLTRH